MGSDVAQKAARSWCRQRGHCFRYVLQMRSRSRRSRAMQDRRRERSIFTSRVLMICALLSPKI